MAITALSQAAYFSIGLLQKGRLSHQNLWQARFPHAKTLLHTFEQGWIRDNLLIAAATAR